jgi:menaquinol-cytochrome c reductase cytochrome b/c subunit
MGLFDFLSPDPAQKQVYDVEYKKMKEEGYPFHPFATWKDMTLGLIILLTLLGLTFFHGVHLDAPADPTSQYLPRPEWYFMFLFQLLKYFPGPTAVVAVAIIPGVVSVALLLLPFYDKNPYRHPKRRPVATTLGLLGIFSLVLLTFLAYWEDYQAHGKGHAAIPAATSVGGHEGAPAATAGGGEGEQVFQSTCKNCHGAEGTMIPGVALFDKKFIADKDIVDIVTHGTSKGMPPQSQLSPAQVKAVAEWVKSQAK